MRLKNRRGFYISNSRNNAKLFEVEPDILDSFWFENPKEIPKERYKEYMNDISAIEGL